MKSKSHVKCPICNTANLPHINNYHICRTCNSFYLFPIKTKDYTDGFWDAFYSQFYIDSDRILDCHDLVNDNKHLFTEDVLEIGSGIGYFIRALNEMNISNIGIDNNRSAITYAKLYNKANIEYFDVENPFDMVKMDDRVRVKTVCIYNTLECFRTPVQTMKFIKRFAKAYIHIIVSSQSVHSITSTNFCMYNEDTIRVLAANIGCIVERIIKDGEKLDVILKI